MIYTLTVNPAIDYHMDLTGNGLQAGAINRSAKETMFPGGKGMNVSVILSRLGITSTAWAFAAGKTGKLLEELAREQGCACDFIYLESGETRINVKLDCDRETAVNGKGPEITGGDARKLLAKADALTMNDTMVLCGNLQTGAGDLYQSICGKCASKQARIIVDTEGAALRDTFAFHPFLIKPNRDELQGLFGEPADDLNEIVKLMLRCRDEGVQNVLVSLGEAGAVLLTEDGSVWQAELLRTRKMVSTVGAGDSMIGGLLAGLEKYDGSWEKALALASAAGSATAYTKWLADRAGIDDVYKDIEVHRIY